MSDQTEPLYDLLAKRDIGVLATIKSDGRPQLSTVKHVFNRETNTIQISITDDRAKTKNLRKDPRVSYHVSTPAGWSYVVVEGIADLSEIAQDPHDEVVEELVDLYRNMVGEHPDWAKYRAAMVRDRRLMLRIHVDRVYGAVSS